ncbi:MAG: bestrophin family ion channel [Puia sp.]|nr:bestrophin family ion channel [Puia sp.]
MLLDAKIPFSYLFSRIRNDLFRVLIISVFFHTLKHFFKNDLPEIPAALPSILGTSISLLLAFELSQSYGRWWEARQIWGAIVNDSRSLVLQLQGFIADEQMAYPVVVELFRGMAYRQMGWCYCLGQSLRKQDPLAGLGPFISQDEGAGLKVHNNKPLYLLNRHSRDLKELYRLGAINQLQQIQLDSTVVRLVDSMGKSERIKGTVFPTTYRRFIHFFIYLFLSVLSLTLLESIGFYEVPLMILVASTFFLIERSAKDMQDPFENKPTDTAVMAIARTIEINIRQLLGEKEVPAPWEPEQFYLL